MADNKIGEGYIEISPELDQAAVKRTKEQVKQHLSGMAREVNKELKKQNRDLVGGFRQQMNALQKGKTSGVFTEYRKEIQAAQRLDAQRQKSMTASRKAAVDNLKAQADEMKRSISAQISLAKQKDQAIAESDRLAAQRGQQQLDALKKNVAAHVALEQQRNDALAAQRRQADEESAARGKAQLDALNRSMAAQAALESQRRAAIDAAHTEALKDDKARTAAMEAAQKAADAKRANRFKWIDEASRSLSQLSTRIGIASFQLQMLGGMFTMITTAPAALGFATLAQDGLSFATNIGYARASMQALLGPAADVERIISDINRITIQSPLFNTEDAIAYAQQLASVDVKAHDLAPTMEAMSNIFLTQGVGGPERAKLAMLAYTQILSKGKIGMDDLRQQFAEHVPGGMKIFEQVAHRLGYKTIKGLSEAMEKGKVTSAELNAEFIELGNSDKYIQGAADASETLGGVWQAFKEEFKTDIGMAFDRNRATIIEAIRDIKPVVKDFVDWFVAAIPVVLGWIGKLAMKANEWKAAYDELSPSVKALIHEMAAWLLMVGPLSVALGIFGTVLSTVANAVSLFMKVFAIAAAGGVASWAVLIAGALMTIAAAMVYFYNASAPFRKVFQQFLNILKDVVVAAILPIVDMLWEALVQLGRVFVALGADVGWLKYALYLLLGPLLPIIAAGVVLVLVIRTVTIAVAALIIAFDGLMWALSTTLMVIESFYRGLAYLPGNLGKAAEATADMIASARDDMTGLVDSGKVWSAATTGVGNATDDLKNKLNGTDFAVNGISDSLGLFSGQTQIAIEKQLTLAEALDNARRAMSTQQNVAASAKDASDDWNRSLIALKDSLEANKLRLDDKSKAGLANRDALKRATQASYEMMLQDIASGVPMDKAIEKHKKRTEELKKEFGRNKDVRKTAQELIDTYGKVPSDVKTLLKMMGYTDVQKKMIEILAAQKVAANPGMSYSKALANERKQWQMEKREGLKGDGFAKGGQIRGPGGPTSDRIPLWASNLEYIIRSRSAQKLGKPTLDYINKTGELPPQYAKGGQVTWPVTLDMRKTKFPDVIGGAGPTGKGMGWANQMRVLRNTFPGLSLLSGFRPGAMTSTGNRSYHSMGRAVDIPPIMEVFNWISRKYGRSTRELIYTPAGGRQIKNGQFHRFTGGSIAQDHFSHIHWAHDNGGYVPPNQPFINKTGGHELILNNSQANALEDNIRNSDSPIYVAVYVDGVKRDAEIVFERKTEELIRALGGA